MIIIISGMPGSGKSTVAKKLAKRMHYKHYSLGGMFRAMAQEQGLSIHQLDTKMKSQPQLDREVDRRLVEVAKKEKNAVMDWRMGFHLFPQSVKIFLDVKPEIGAKRIFKEKRKSEKENITLEQTKARMHQRHTELVKRLKKIYGVDFSDQSKFDLVVDTSHISVKEVVDRIVEFLEKENLLKS